MSDAEKSVDDVRRIERLLKAETGLRVIASSDAEVRSKFLKYCKTCLKRPLQNRQNKDINDKW